MYKRISTIALALALGAAVPATAAPVPEPGTIPGQAPAPAPTPENPLVVTGDVRDVTETQAVMTGTVDMGGGISSAFFRFGTTPELEMMRSPLAPVGPGPGASTQTFLRMGLTPGTRYYYQLVVNLSSGGAGEIRSFVTAGTPPVESPPTEPPPVEAPAPEPSKLQLARATISSSANVIDILAPITQRASGAVSIELHAAGQRHSWDAPVDAANRQIRQRASIPAAQAAKRTGILTIRYAGNALTRPQTVRLRAANVPAVLRSERPSLTDGRLRASGTVSRAARGVVRVQLEYFANGATTTLQRNARIANGTWRLDEPLTPGQLTAIDLRRGPVHSYVLFTGYLPAKMRGEMRSFEVLGAL